MLDIGLLQFLDNDFLLSLDLRYSLGRSEPINKIGNHTENDETDEDVGFPA
jgi:hypothetical protein